MTILIYMSTYILMKIFESIPSAYDRGMQIITLGAVNKVYDRLVLSINKNDRVLDIGCGTGALLVRAAVKGAHVKGMDINPGMLDIAQKRIDELCPGNTARVVEMGVAELGKEEPGYYDVVMSSLCFSELTAEEVHFTMEQVRRILKPGGLFLVADEVHPKNPLFRFLFFSFPGLSSLLSHGLSPGQ
jgi:demethylmenaquinone methyltransferase/2-methoxy-6-polyprenyl-1,4-benzoquinol methylase